MDVRGRRAIEDHANGVYSAIKVCTTTRYENRKRGVATPTSSGITDWIATNDDHTELFVRDAADVLGLDLSTLSRADKKRLAEVLQ